MGDFYCHHPRRPYQGQVTRHSCVTQPSPSRGEALTGLARLLFCSGTSPGAANLRNVWPESQKGSGK